MLASIPSLTPFELPVFGERYIAPEGGIDLNVYPLDRFLPFAYLEHHHTSQKLLRANKQLEFEDGATGARICSIQETRFNGHRPVLDQTGRRLFKVRGLGIFGRKNFAAKVKSLKDGLEYDVKYESHMIRGSVTVIGPDGRSELVGIEEEGVFRKYRVIRIAEGMDYMVVFMLMVLSDLRFIYANAGVMDA
ncbi:hypothetical protein BJ742DRAFT_845350 [Cladochytrium replicatum]|nr:hypothetical protein BJ742DRAFT_845350 [Cladochytrium replicatum]